MNRIKFSKNKSKWRLKVGKVLICVDDQLPEFDWSREEIGVFVNRNRHMRGWMRRTSLIGDCYYCSGKVCENEVHEFCPPKGRYVCVFCENKHHDDSTCLCMKEEKC